jgi:hypothetical protein
MKTLRIFLSVFALAITCVYIGNEIHRNAWNWDDIYVSLFPSTCYVALALAFWRSNDPDKLPGKPWLRAVFWLSAIMVVIGLSTEWSDGDITVRASLLMAAVCSGFMCLVYVCLHGGQALMNGFRPKIQRELSRARRLVATLCITAGALTVLSTLLLKITDGSPGTGWDVIIGRNVWITSHYNLATAVIFGPTIQWLAPIFGPTGRAFYAVGILSSVALIVLLVFARFSFEKLLGMPLLRPAMASQILFFGYLLNDLSWGAESVSHEPILATIAAICWLAEILFVAFIARTIANGTAKPWYYPLLIAFLIPLVIEQVVLAGLMLLVGAPGLIALVLGTLLGSIGCFMLSSRFELSATSQEKPERNLVSEM